jgi:hypothetical protein
VGVPQPLTARLLLLWATAGRVREEPAARGGAGCRLPSDVSLRHLADAVRAENLRGVWLHLAAAGECAAERDLVCVLEVAADGEAAREARYPDAPPEPVR